jgi:hypothetical protein
MTEREAATALVAAYRDAWPKMRELLTGALGVELTGPKHKNPEELFPHFLLACIASELQTLENLFPSAQAARIKAQIQNVVAEQLGAEALEEIAEYEAAWSEGLANLPYRETHPHLPTPFELVAERAVAKWLGIDGQVMVATPVALFIGELLGFWKLVKDRWRLVPQG